MCLWADNGVAFTWCPISRHLQPINFPGRHLGTSRSQKPTCAWFCLYSLLIFECYWKITYLISCPTSKRVDCALAALALNLQASLAAFRTIWSSDRSFSWAPDQTTEKEWRLAKDSSHAQSKRNFGWMLRFFNDTDRPAGGVPIASNKVCIQDNLD